MKSDYTMKKLFDYLKENSAVALSVPTVLCAVQFAADVITVLKTGHFDNALLSQMMSSANGFETVVLFAIMLALKNKK
jgi:hypothetical protein